MSTNEKKKKLYMLYGVIAIFLVFAIMGYVVLSPNKLGLTYEQVEGKQEYLIDGTYGSFNKKRKLIIPSTYKGLPITKLGDWAFSEHRAKEVIFEEECKITEIGERAFERLLNLNSITLPDSVVFIDEYAFNDCKNLKEIHFGANLQKIEAYAFNYCLSLTTITYNGTVKQCGEMLDNFDLDWRKGLEIESIECTDGTFYLSYDAIFG